MACSGSDVWKVWIVLHDIKQMFMYYASNVCGQDKNVSVLRANIERSNALAQTFIVRKFFELNFNKRFVWEGIVKTCNFE